LLKAKIDFLGFKIERTQLKRVFMSWIQDGKPVPVDTESFGKLSKTLEDTIMFRVLVERD
jgi:hypothetical protein